MPNTPDGLTFTQEGRNVRATDGKFVYRLPEADCAATQAAYEKWLAQARAHFEPRWRAVHGHSLDAVEFAALARQATLHWMYYYLVNRLPVQITADDWRHPQTDRIIQALVETKYGAHSEATITLCAQLMGYSRSEYLDWKAGDDLFSGR